MKVNKWVTFGVGVAGAVIAIPCINFLKGVKRGQNNVPEDVVLEGIEKARSIDDKLVVENYETTRKEHEILVNAEAKKINKMISEEKEKMGYQDKLAEIKSKAKSFRDQFKNEIDYSGQKEKLKKALDESIKNQKAEAKIDFRLAEQEAVKVKADKEYTDRSLKIALVSLGEQDDELRKTLESKIKDDHDKAIKAADEEIKKINEELSNIQKANRDNYEKALSDLDNLVAENCKTVEKAAKESTDALHRQIDNRYEELVKEVKGKRSKADNKTIADYEQACEKYSRLIESEKQKALTKIADLTDSERAAIYLRACGWDSGMVNFVTYTTTGVVVFFAAKALLYFVKLGRSVARVMKTYEA